MNNKKILKYIITTILLLSCAFALVSCTEVTDIQNAGTVKVGDYPVVAGDITINQKPTKVAVLDDSVADMIIAMKYETSLNIASADCTQPELETLTKISRSDTDGIIAAGSDLILAHSFTESEKTAFTDAGITFIEVAEATNRESFEQMYTLVGSVLAGAETGYTTGLTQAQDIFTTLDDIQRLVPSDRVTTAVCLIDESKAVTGDDLLSNIMTYAGLMNGFTSMTGSQYTLEDLDLINPQIIFTSSQMAEKLTSEEQYADLYAVKASTVYILEEDDVTRAGRTLILTASTFAGMAYPELLNPETVDEPEYDETTSSEVSSQPNTNDDPAVSTQPESQVEATPAPTQEPLYQTLTLGDNSDEVMTMNERLVVLGYLTDGQTTEFTQTTEQAVIDFQTLNGLEATGIADSPTLELMYSDLAVFAPIEEGTGEG